MRSGFMLLEVIVATAVLSVALLAMLAFLMDSSELFRDESIHADLNAKSRRVIDAVARDLAGASASRLSPMAPFRSPSLLIQRAVGFDPDTHAVLFSPSRILYRVETQGAERCIVRYEDFTRPATRGILATDVAPADGLTFTIEFFGDAVVVGVKLQRLNRQGRLIVYSRTETIQLRN